MAENEFIIPMNEDPEDLNLPNDMGELVLNVTLSDVGPTGPPGQDGKDGEVSQEQLDVVDGKVSTNTVSISTLNNKLQQTDNDVLSVQNRVSTAENDISLLDGRLGTAEGSISTATSNVSGLTTRMGTAEYNVAELTSKTNTLTTNANTLKGRVDGHDSDIVELQAERTYIEYASGTEFEPTGAWSTGARTNVTGFHWQRSTIGGVTGAPELVEKPLTGVGRNLFKYKQSAQQFAQAIPRGYRVSTDIAYGAAYVEAPLVVTPNSQLVISARIKQLTALTLAGVSIRPVEKISDRLGEKSTSLFDALIHTRFVTTNSGQIRLYLYSNMSQVPMDAVAEFTDIKIELGTVATPWQPAPEDTHTITPVVRDGRLMSKLEYGDYVVYTKTKIDERVDAVADRVLAVEVGIERSRIKQYGVRRQLGTTSAELERLGDAVGLIANADNSLTTWNKVTNDFDHIYPWSHMRKCKINAGGTVVYDSYPTFGSFDGDWMIEIPEFYLKHTNDGTNMDYWISRYPLDDYEKVEKFYISQFKTTGGHTSLPNAAPLTSLSLDGFRNGAVAKGDGWRIVDMYANYIIRVLYQIEFAHLNSQLILGNGVTSVRYTEDDVCLLAETATNRAVVSDSAAANYEVGETVCIGSVRGSSQGAKDRLITAINALGDGQTEIVLEGDPFNTLTTYRVYSAAQHTGKTLQLTSSSGQAVGRTGRQSISYRGIEDWFGNVYDWTDGCLIEDHQAYVCLDPSKYSSTLTEDYLKVGYKNSAASGYVLELGFDPNFKHVQFSSTAGGGSTTGYCDYYYQSTGLRATLFGGHFLNGSDAGAFLWTLARAPSSASFNVGSRLLYKPA